MTWRSQRKLASESLECAKVLHGTIRLHADKLVNRSLFQAPHLLLHYSMLHLPCCISFVILSFAPPASAAPITAGQVKVVEAEATYTMGDGDTLAGAEEQVLLRAKRKAVEEAGVYIEASSNDIETTSAEKTSRLNSLGIRTVAAAVTETDILEKRRTLEGDRLTFYVKIRAKVHVDWLAEAIKRIKADEQLAEHHRQLHLEYAQLKAQLDRLRKQLAEAGPSGRERPHPVRDRRTARELTRSAIKARSLPNKIDLATRAIAADDQYIDAYIIRGQTYLRIASLTYTKKEKRSELNTYVELAVRDFDRALALDETSTWALLGRGDALTWQRKTEEAAKDYERILQLDPLFDIARQRLIALYTSVAQRQVQAKRWREALTTLNKLLHREETQSWVAHEKEAYLLRSQVHERLGEPERAISDLTKVIGVDPTNINALILRAQLYQQLRQGRLAREDHERACTLGAEEACEALNQPFAFSP